MNLHPFRSFVVYFPDVRKGIFLSLLFLHFSSAELFSAVPDTGSSSSWQDESFIRSFRSNPHFTFEFARRRQVLDIRNSELDTFLLRFEPNTRTNFIASFDYKWLSLSLGLISFPTVNGARKGNSSQFSLRANFNGRRVWNSNFIQLYRGFFLTNPLSVDPDWNPQIDQYPQRSDVHTTTWFSNFYYCFKPERFSYRAAIWQLDRQEKSAGSFLAGASIRYYGLNSDSAYTLIPENAFSLFNADELIVAQRVSNLGFNIGYVHTFVYNKSWFLTLYFVPGLSLQNSVYQAQNQQIVREPTRFVGMSEFRIITGYNGDKWFAGLSSYSISFSGNDRQGIWIDNSYNWFRMFAGFRINGPSSNRKSKLLERIGL
ncbi:MAG: DUF4421 family protein [Bacteroidia bacterium]